MPKDINVNYCNLLGISVIVVYCERQINLLIDMNSIDDSILIKEVINKVSVSKKV